MEKEEEMKNYKENSQFEEETAKYLRKLEEFDRTKHQIKVTYDGIMNEIREESLNYQSNKDTLLKSIPETKKACDTMVKEGKNLNK